MAMQDHISLRYGDYPKISFRKIGIWIVCPGKKGNPDLLYKNEVLDWSIKVLVKFIFQKKVGKLERYELYVMLFK